MSARICQLKLYQATGDFPLQRYTEAMEINYEGRCLLRGLLPEDRFPWKAIASKVLKVHLSRAGRTDCS